MTLVEHDEFLQTRHQNVADWAFRHFGVNAYKIARGLCVASLLGFMGAWINTLFLEWHLEGWKAVLSIAISGIFCPFLILCFYIQTFTYENEAIRANYSPTRTKRTHGESLKSRVCVFWLMLPVLIFFVCIAVLFLSIAPISSAIGAISTALTIAPIPFYSHLVSCDIPPRSGKPNLLDRARLLFESRVVEIPSA